MQKRQIGWRTRTRAGVAAILFDGARYRARFDDEDLGSYHSAAQALDDLLGGHTFSPSGGVDTSTLGLPDDLSEWEPVFAAS